MNAHDKLLSDLNALSSRSAQLNDTLRRFPREMQRGDERSWWVSAEAAAAQEDFIKAQFSERPKQSRSDAWAEIAIYLIAVGCAVAGLLGAFA